MDVKKREVILDNLSFEIGVKYGSLQIDNIDSLEIDNKLRRFIEQKEKGREIFNHKLNVDFEIRLYNFETSVEMKFIISKVHGTSKVSKAGTKVVDDDDVNMFDDFEIDGGTEDIDTHEVDIELTRENGWSFIYDTTEFKQNNVASFNITVNWAKIDFKTKKVNIEFDTE